MEFMGFVPEKHGLGERLPTQNVGCKQNAEWDREINTKNEEIIGNVPYVRRSGRLLFLRVYQIFL